MINLKLKLENIVFLIIFLLIIFGGGIKPFVLPKQNNYLENRSADQIPYFKFNEFVNKEFQSKYELALSDQIPLALRMKYLEKDFSLKLKLLYYQSKNEFYTNLGYDVFLVKNYLVSKPYVLEAKKEYLNRKANNINNIVKNVSNVNYYVYYIEKDEDINFETGEKPNAFEYLKSKLNPKIKIDNFNISNIKEYQNYFYKTDHHWNYIGSYEGYKEVISLLGYDNYLKPNNEKCVTSLFHGSKNVVLGSNKFEEKFCFYEYNLPNYDVFNNIDQKDAFANDTVSSPAYWKYYGMDRGIITYDFHDENKENLLIIGDSFDNAINELIASHFNKTYNVDLRHYKDQEKQEFLIKNFIKEHNISKVLFIGNIGFFASDTFLIKEDF